MTICSIRQPPSPTMRRRLRMSRDRGWLVRLHGVDCTRLTGTVTSLDVGAMRCVLVSPGTIHPEHEVDLDGICEVQVVSAALMHPGRLLARFAAIAPWRGGSADPQTLLADLMSGTVCIGDQGTLLLDDGVRRPGVIEAMREQRCRIEFG
jgi:hypothetical protein